MFLLVVSALDLMSNRVYGVKPCVRVFDDRQRYRQFSSRACPQSQRAHSLRRQLLMNRSATRDNPNYPNRSIPGASVVDHEYDSPVGGRPRSCSTTRCLACGPGRDRPLPPLTCSNRLMDVRRPDWWTYPDQCQHGHQWGPGRVIVSWMPCQCAPARAARARGSGHRTIACREPGCTSVYYEPRHDRETAI
jgi:hypothetical protein